MKLAEQTTVEYRDGVLRITAAASVKNQILGPSGAIEVRVRGHDVVVLGVEHGYRPQLVSGTQLGFVRLGQAKEVVGEPAGQAVAQCALARTQGSGDGGGRQ